MTISENRSRFVDTFHSEAIPNTLIKHNDHRLGVLFILASAVAFSTAGFFARLIELDVSTVLFWRVFSVVCSLRLTSPASTAPKP